METTATRASTLIIWVHQSSAHTRQDTEEARYDAKAGELTTLPKEVSLWKDGESPYFGEEPT